MAAVEMVECEVWVMVNEDGTYEASTVLTDLQANVGEACRMVRLVVNVPKPRAVLLTATIADEPDTAELNVA